MNLNDKFKDSAIEKILSRNTQLGADGAKGFQNGIADVLAKHKEREE